MKQIFAGEIFEVMPLSGGIIFSYCKEKVDENIIVAYKMISFDNGRFTDVAIDDGLTMERKIQDMEVEVLAAMTGL